MYLLSQLSIQVVGSMAAARNGVISRVILTIKQAMTYMNTEILLCIFRYFWLYSVCIYRYRYRYIQRHTHGYVSRKPGRRPTLAASRLCSSSATSRTSACGPTSNCWVLGERRGQHRLRGSIRMCRYIDAQKHMHVYIHRHIYRYAYLHMYTFTYAHMHTLANKYMQKSMSSRLCIHIYML